MIKSNFQNPYQLHPQWSLNKLMKLTARVPQDEGDKLYSICPEKGAIQIVINHLWKKLVNECERRKITTYLEREEFFNLVTNSVLTMPLGGCEENGGATIQRVSTPRSVSKTNGRDESGGKKKRNSKDKTTKG